MNTALGGKKPSLMDRRCLAAVLRSGLWMAVFAGAPTPQHAASKEELQLKLSLAQLREQVVLTRQMQDASLAQLTILARQVQEASEGWRAAAASLNGTFQQHFRLLEGEVLLPVAGFATQTDEVSADVRMMQQAVTDLMGPVRQIQTNLVDVGNAIKILISAAEAPARLPSPAGSRGVSAASAATFTAPSLDLYNSAERDRASGKWERALQEYLRYYGRTDLAAGSQFHIAFIHYSQRDYTNALKEFQNVLERYPASGWTAEALFYMGMALTKLNRSSQATAEFTELVLRFPDHNLAKQAMAHLSTPAKHKDLEL
jgi:TolA-binding protein